MRPLRHPAVGGLHATSPQYAAGMRMEPPASVPTCNGPKHAAPAAPAPEEEPPGVRARFHGLRGVPIGLRVRGTPYTVVSEHRSSPAAQLRPGKTVLAWQRRNALVNVGCKIKHFYRSLASPRAAVSKLMEVGTANW